VEENIAGRFGGLNGTHKTSKHCTPLMRIYCLYAGRKKVF
jgi:hypothetical protein